MARYTIRQTTKYKTVSGLNDRIFGDGFELPFDQHYCWLVYYDGEPIGYASMRECEPRVVFLSRVGVLPEHRGHGLQKKLIKARCKLAKELSYRWAITYTSLENAPSFESLQQCSFKMYLPEYRWAGVNFVYWRKQLNV